MRELTAVEMEHVNGGSPGGASAAVSATGSVSGDNSMRGGMPASSAITNIPIFILPILPILIRHWWGCPFYPVL